MSWSHAARLFNTVRYLRAEQVFYRLRYRLSSPAVRTLPTAAARQWSRRWPGHPLSESTLVAPATFRFLGESGRLDSAADWNDPRHSLLWLYNLHYLDDLNADGATSRLAQHRSLVQRWIEENPPGHGRGWEPYPLSLRIVNLVKWLSRSGEGEPRFLASLATQSEALSRRIEYHLLGNHLFANAKALTFAGAFLSGSDAERWLALGTSLLDREIPEQFLADGGHFERSPMYQGALLADLLDLVQLADIATLPALRARRATWAEVASRALSWLATMTHPDGEIAFFNDAAMGIAPSAQRLVRYAESLLPAASAAPAAHEFGLLVLRDSGYCRVDLPAHGAAILDVAALGPDYLPAHGHADTLSFELSLFGARVFVNSGTSVYGEGAERLRQRGTAAHNTVMVDDADSSEVWSGFRVASRARANLKRAEADGERIVVEGSHDGYQRLPGRNTHFRGWSFERDSLQIDDAVTGRFRRAQGRLHLHPAVTVVQLDGAAGRARLRLAGGQDAVVEVTGAQLGIEPATWHPRFGASEANRCLTFEFEGSRATVRIDWRQGSGA